MAVIVFLWLIELLILYNTCESAAFLRVYDVSVERISVVAELDGEEFVNIVSKLTVTIFVTSDFTTPIVDQLKQGETNMLYFQKEIEIPLIGIQYKIAAIIVSNTNQFGLTKAHNSNPLPPRQFSFVVEKSEASFRFLPPSKQSENGTTALYDFVLILCTNEFSNIPESEEVEHWRLTVEAMLVDENEYTEIKRQLTDGDMYKIFKHGGHVTCSLSSAAHRDALLYSTPLYSSYILQPVVPTIRIAEIKHLAPHTIINIEMLVDRKTQTFSRLRVVVGNERIAAFRWQEIEEVVSFNFSVATSGTAYVMEVKVWSVYVSNKRKTSVELIPVFVPPLPPRSMNIQLIDEQVFVNIELGPPSRNTFDFLNLNSSGNPNSVLLFNKRNITLLIRWRNLDPGKEYTFQCWVVSVFEGEKHPSAKLSTKYTSMPSAPINFTATRNDSSVIVFKWSVDGRGYQDGFVLSVCLTANLSVCLRETYLNASETKFQLVKRLDMVTVFTAWVQAIFKGKRSDKSKLLNINAQDEIEDEDVINTTITPGSDELSTVKPTESKSVSTNPFVIIGIVSGVISLLSCGFTVGICFRQRKRRRKNVILRYDPNVDLSGLSEKLRKAIKEQEEENKQIKSATKRHAREMRSQSIIEPSLELIKETSAEKSNPASTSTEKKS